MAEHSFSEVRPVPVVLLEFAVLLEPELLAVDLAFIVEEDFDMDDFGMEDFDMVEEVPLPCDRMSFMLGGCSKLFGLGLALRAGKLPRGIWLSRPGSPDPAGLFAPAPERPVAVVPGPFCAMAAPASSVAPVNNAT